ncbi:hypothetical protein H4219_000438 [Mycoemilia scoparia]|uniref:ELYS-like domain-containing protein n=1 Tax=Mycoemilia scoparia TaxID=417184 RepID=A0A9W8A2T2_9FUNG|nr:hypothetical protein H4219_000438 [Mycoemilia scoparia]
MDVFAEVPSLPRDFSGHRPFPSKVSGGYVGFPSTSDASNSKLFYRYTQHGLEVRDGTLLSSQLPEALAVFSTSTMVSYCSSEPTIEFVMPIVIGGEAYFVIIIKRSQDGQHGLLLFHPYTLNSYPIDVALPQNITAMDAIGLVDPLEEVDGPPVYGMIAIASTHGAIHLGKLHLCFSNECGMSANVTLVNHQTSSTEDMVAISLKHMSLSPTSILIFVADSSQKCEVLRLDLENGAEFSTLAKIRDNSIKDHINVLKIDNLTPHRYNLSIGVGARAVDDVSNPPPASIFVYFLSIDSNWTVSCVPSGSAAINVPKPSQHSMRNRGASARPVGGTVAQIEINNIKDRAVLTVLVVAPHESQASSFQANSNAFKTSRSYVASFEIASEGLFHIHTLEQIGTTLGERALAISIDPMYAELEMLAQERVFGSSLFSFDLVPENSSSGLSSSVDIEQFIGRDPSEFPYPLQARQDVTSFRQKLGGDLFFDLLLGLADIDSKSVYPPKDLGDLRKFISAIYECGLDSLKKHSLVLYLLIDQGAASGDPSVFLTNWELPESASRYAKQTFIPQHFQHLVAGYWLIDHGKVPLGLSYLSDPAVEADWAIKILRASIVYKCFREARYFMASVKSVLDETPEDIVILMTIYLHCSLDEAFFFQRRYVDDPSLREYMLTQLFTHCLSSSSHKRDVDRLLELPFDSDEEYCLIQFCRDSSAIIVKDFLAMYYIHHGRHIEAIRVYDEIVALEKDLEPLTPALQRKSKARQLISQNLRMLLPAAQLPTLALYDKELDMDSNQLYDDDDDEEWVITQASQGSKIRSETGDMDIDAEAEAADNPEESTEHIKVVAKPTKLDALQIPPLSASRAIRRRAPIGNNSGAAHAPQQALIKALMRQMFSNRPIPESIPTDAPTSGEQTADGSFMDRVSEPGTPRTKVGTNAPGSPWKTPTSVVSARGEQSPGGNMINAVSPAAGLRRVPFVGPPVTPKSATTPYSSFSPAPGSQQRHSLAADEWSPTKRMNNVNVGHTPGPRRVGGSAIRQRPFSTLGFSSPGSNNPTTSLPGGFPSPFNKSPFNIAKSTSTPESTKTANSYISGSPGTPSKLPGLGSTQSPVLSRYSPSGNSSLTSLSPTKTNPFSTSPSQTKSGRVSFTSPTHSSPNSTGSKTDPEIEEKQKSPEHPEPAIRYNLRKRTTRSSTYTEATGDNDEGQDEDSSSYPETQYNSNRAGVSVLNNAQNRPIKSAMSSKERATSLRTTRNRQTSSPSSSSSVTDSPDGAHIPGGFPKESRKSSQPKGKPSPSQYRKPASTVTTRLQSSRLKKVSFAEDLDEQDQNDDDMDESSEDDDLANNEKVPEPNRINSKLMMMDASKTPRYARTRSRKN